jgi:hypothetical protein
MHTFDQLHWHLFLALPGTLPVLWLWLWLPRRIAALVVGLLALGYRGWSSSDQTPPGPEAGAHDRTACDDLERWSPATATRPVRPVVESHPAAWG